MRSIETLNKQLFVAVKAKSLLGVKQALPQGAEINAIGGVGLTPPHASLHNSPLDWGLILRLFAAGAAHPNIHQPDNSRPLKTLVME